MMKKYVRESYIETEYMRRYTEEEIKKCIPRWKKYIEDDNGYAIKWMFSNATIISVEYAKAISEKAGFGFKPEFISENKQYLEVRIYLKDGKMITKDEYEDQRMSNIPYIPLTPVKKI